MSGRSMSGTHNVPTTPGSDRRYAQRTLVVAAQTRYTALERARERMKGQGLIPHPFQGRAVETGDGLYRVDLRVAQPTGGID